MTLTRRWATGSVDDLETAVEWYNERQPGLGAEFALEVFSATQATMRRPFVLKRYEHPNLPSGAEVRKVQLKRFSEYGVIYTVVGEAFWILAVAHAKRRPGYWSGRLAQLPSPPAIQPSDARD